MHMHKKLPIFVESFQLGAIKNGEVVKKYKQSKKGTRRTSTQEEENTDKYTHTHIQIHTRGERKKGKNEKESTRETFRSLTNVSFCKKRHKILAGKLAFKVETAIVHMKCFFLPSSCRSCNFSEGIFWRTLRPPKECVCRLMDGAGTEGGREGEVFFQKCFPLQKKIDWRAFNCHFSFVEKAKTCVFDKCCCSWAKGNGEARQPLPFINITSYRNHISWCDYCVGKPFSARLRPDN